MSAQPRYESIAAAPPADAGPESVLAKLRQRIEAAADLDEATRVAALRAELAPASALLAPARARAIGWVEAARASAGGLRLERMLEQFPLDSAAGQALMSLAEALLRTPDVGCADELIAERLGAIARAPRGSDEVWWARAMLASLRLGGRLLPSGVPMVRPAARAVLGRAMRRLGDAFIVGHDLESALARAARLDLGLCSFDVLGEGARTVADAQRYYEAYARAIDVLARQPAAAVHARSGISVKLSALEPRYALQQRRRVLEGLVPRVMELARKAARAGVGFTVDAEEADRLEISLDVIEALAADPQTTGWAGLGLAVQAYGRRTPELIDWVAALARTRGRRMAVRLVKGAYWDSEIKRAQERGLAQFPVYTRKAATDLSYLACARRLFGHTDMIYPQFATHNAHTIAAVLALAPRAAAWEFQRLHGMGVALYAAVRASEPALPPVRVYAPVGTHEDLLPYLVRRLLENGANSSFVHRFMNPKVPAAEVVSDPLAELDGAEPARTPGAVREPERLYAAARRNSRGADFGDPRELQALVRAARTLPAGLSGGPIIRGAVAGGLDQPVRSPADLTDIVGQTRDASEAEIAQAFAAAAAAQPAWDRAGAEQRAGCLEGAADLLEARRDAFVGLIVREAGRTLPDAIAELREAVDFCRYYAAQGRQLFGAPLRLEGPTGERNELALHGRGVFTCISPWNFPLAIFTGQVTAALMAGNAVLAKPAPQTPLVAHAMTRLLHEAGVPVDVLHLTPAEGPAFGRAALTDRHLAGVAFTGSTLTATTINRTLAGREGPILPLIAETGGVNAMIVDATALPEQVVDDVIASSFTSAGQRCSALRVLYLQDAVADRVIEMLVGAMRCLTIGDPADPATDVGPVISADARDRLERHAARMRAEARLLHACELPEACARGSFFAPQLFELHAPDQLRTEEFGPILHVVRWRAAQLEEVLAAVRGSGYGLTLGIHSRLESFAAQVHQALPAGNTYVNRNMIGAVVGVQPFGGQGLSGTGPKAGGPHYLLRFATERTLTINTAAIGGNIELLT